MSASTVISDEKLRTLAPSVFADSAHSSRSDRYNYIPTAKIVEGLRSEGFAPVKVQVARVRDDDRHGFEKHMIRFRRFDDIARLNALQTGGHIRIDGGIHPEIILVNSHDGTTSYKLSAGLFRLVCSNGLVIQQGNIDEIRIPHTGKQIVEDVVEGSYRVLEQSKLGVETASQWSQLQLTGPEQTALAIGAHHLRFADSEGNLNTPFQPAQLLRARRIDDTKSDLWTVFNRIQENVIRGGLHAVDHDSEGRRRRSSTREVKGIDQNISLNKALWKMAEHLAQSKNAN